MARTFDPARPVTDEVIERALGAAIQAPSAGFTQGWDFVVLRSEVDRSRFWDSATPAMQTAPDRWLRGVSAAPCLIVCCSDPGAYERRYAEPDKAGAEPHPWPIPYWDVDTGMAALLMLLTAVDEGLGSLFFGVPAASMDAVQAALSIPKDRRLVGVVALGYPLPDIRSPSLARGRRELTEVAHEGRFGVAWERASRAITTRSDAHWDGTSNGIPNPEPTK